jgi:hypothetical protein
MPKLVGVTCRLRTGGAQYRTMATGISEAWFLQQGTDGRSVQQWMKRLRTRRLSEHC